MSAVRLEVETHIVAGAATSVQNLSQVHRQLRRPDRRDGHQLAGRGRGHPDRYREGAGRPRGRYRRRHDRHRDLRRRRRLPHRRAAGRRHQRDERRRHRPAHEPQPGRGDQDQARHRQPGRRRAARSSSTWPCSARPAGQTIQRRKLCEVIEARMGEIFSLIREEVKRSGHAGMLPAGAVLTGGGARLAGVERPGARHARDAGARRLAAGRRRAHGPDRQSRHSARRSGCCCGARTTSARSRSATAAPTARTRSRASATGSGTSSPANKCRHRASSPRSLLRRRVGRSRIYRYRYRR